MTLDNSDAAAAAVESPLWLLLQVSPVRNEKELVVLLLIVVKDITALRQPIDEDSYSAGSVARTCFIDHTQRLRAPRARIQRYTLIILGLCWLCLFR